MAGAYEEKEGIRTVVVNLLIRQTNLSGSLRVFLGPLHRHDVGLYLTGHAHHPVQHLHHLQSKGGGRKGRERKGRIGREGGREREGGKNGENREGGEGERREEGREKEGGVKDIFTRMG